MSCLFLSLLLMISSREASGSWEYPGACAEVFDLDVWTSTAEPEGMAACLDGVGGLLVAAHDAASTPASIRVNRLAQDGTEVWGQGGTVVPRDVGSEGQSSPVAISCDGAGGAWVAYVELWSDYGLFRLAHLTSTGALERIVSIDNTGGTTDLDALSIRLVPIAGGDVLMAWTQRGMAPRLHAARVATSGVILWHTDVNQGYTHRTTVGSNTWTTWDVSSDMLDGLLVTWLRLQTGTPEIGAQRIGPDGAVWWGADGRLLWSGYALDFHDPVIVGDVIGGAFVVMSRRGIATAQHLDPWGNVQWAAGGIAIQDSGTPYWAQSTDPVVCEDGAFGFTVAHGNEDLYAQRVDYWGNLLWGSGVALGHRAGQQNKPAIARDGFGGAVVVWQDKYYALPNQPWHALVGTRLDASGGLMWGPQDLYIAWTAHDPHDPVLVPDGGGGGLCAFANFDLEEYADDVWALGVSPEGTSGVDLHTAELRMVAEPNPFRTSTRIVIERGESLPIDVGIYDSGGRRIRGLGTVSGRHAFVEWDGRNDLGLTVPRGIYLVRFGSESGVRGPRIVCLR